MLAKKREYYEKKVKQKQIDAGEQYGVGMEKVTPNLGEAISTTNRHKNETNAKLASQAGVGTETYRKGKKILDSDNEIIKQKVKSAEMSIDAGYKELVGKKGKEKVEDRRTYFVKSKLQELETSGIKVGSL